MSTEVKDPPETGEGQPEFVKQIKGEMNRKLDKQAEQITSLMKQQQDLLAALQAAQSKPAPKQEVTESELSDLAFNDPKKFAQVVSKQAIEESQRITDARIAQDKAAMAAQLEVQQTVAQLAGEYPELADQDSDLVKTTLEIIGTIPEAQRGGLAYKYAVKEAAGRLDMKPRSKREDEQFVGSTYSPPKGRSKARSDAQAVEQGRGFAQALGVNIDDPKFKETYLSILKQRGIK